MSKRGSRVIWEHGAYRIEQGVSDGEIAYHLFYIGTWVATFPNFYTAVFLAEKLEDIGYGSG